MTRWLEIALVIVGLGIVFLVVNYIHFQNFSVHVVLYSCIVDALIASAVFLPVYMLATRGRSALRATEFTLAALAGNLFIIIYAIMGPTVVDRSLSIYIVEKLDNRGGRIAEDKMDDIFIQEYLPEYRLMDVRLVEQLQSGTVRIEKGCVILTDRGRFLAQVMRTYRKMFLPKKRVLLGEVTDVLTDPFRDAKAVVDVTCPPG